MKQWISAWKVRMLVILAGMFFVSFVVGAQEEGKQFNPGVVLRPVSFDTTVEKQGVTFWKTPNEEEYQYTPPLIIHPRVFLSEEANEIGFWVRYDGDVLQREVRIEGGTDQTAVLRDYITEKIRRVYKVESPRFSPATQVRFELRLNNEDGSWRFRQKNQAYFANLKSDKHTIIPFVYDGPRLTPQTLPRLLRDRYLQFECFLYVSGRTESHVEGRVRFSVRQDVQDIERIRNTRVFIFEDSEGEQRTDVSHFLTHDLSGWSSYDASAEHQTMLASFLTQATRACFQDASYGSIPNDALIRVSEGYFQKADLERGRDAIRALLDFRGDEKIDASQRGTRTESGEAKASSNERKSQEESDAQTKERHTEGGGEAGISSGGGRSPSSGTSTGWAGRLGKLIDALPSVDLRVRGTISGTTRDEQNSKLKQEAERAASEGSSASDFIAQEMQFGLADVLGGSITMNLLDAVNLRTSSFKRVVHYQFEQSTDFRLHGYNSMVDVTSIVYVESPPIRDVYYTTDGTPPDVPRDSTQVFCTPCDRCDGKEQSPPCAECSGEGIIWWKQRGTEPRERLERHP